VNRITSKSVIIAALNEEEGIGLTIAELRQHVDDLHIFVVDGKSTDRTVQVAKNEGACILFQDGIGKGNAIAKAIDSIDLSGDYVVLTDGDYTYPAEYIPKMIEILESDPHIGMVLGNRFNNHLIDTKALHSVYYFGNRVIAFTHNLLNGVPLRDPLTGLRVVRTEILKDWTVKSKKFEVEVELNHLVERKGFNIIEIPIKYRQRLGEKKLKIADGASILKRILAETRI
jgi:dolichol-phosphate hexosyltransferase